MVLAGKKPKIDNKINKKEKQMKKLLFLLACCICRLTVNAQTYELVMLDTSTNESCAYGINSFGYICGYKILDGKSTPYLWSPNKGFLALNKPPNATIDTGIAYSIDDYFDIVGTYGYYGSNPHHISSGTAAAWLLDENAENFVTHNVNIPAPMGAREVNDNGDIVGSNTGGANNFGYVYNVFDNSSYIANLGFSMFFGINKQGNICGMMRSDYYNFSPVFIRKERDGARTVFSGENIGGGIYLPSGGYKVNTNNQVIGIANNQGFYWEPETGSNTLFGVGTSSYSINNKRVIVGTSNGHACMWSPRQNNSFSVVDLNQLSGDTNILLETAFNVNDLGQIVGQALNKTTGVRSAFMLTPSKGVRVTFYKGTNGLTLSWTSVVNHNYSIHTSTDLKVWTPLPDYYLAEDTKAWVTVPPDRDHLFFRVFDLTP